MKKLILCLSVLFLFTSVRLFADSSINITPLPKSMTVGNGRLVLPTSFGINTGDLPDDVVAEAAKFATVINKVTGYSVSTNAGSDALIKLSLYNGSEELGKEGYTLDVTTSGITVSANSATGFYFAFQSIKKMLPACVMAEVRDESVTEFALPVVSITDAPRFEYRGFMLDVSRHYFTMKEIKRMIDVMSYYKMNRFHWHLTDDQGWRIEIEKYPRLTSIGAVRNNSWNVDPVYGGYYTNEPYGPYFYTKEEAREIVAYAKERHIEVIPEVEFPGHSCAAVTAYPEYSCYPNGSHSVQVDGGIFSDVLNVGSEITLQFAKDILDEICEIFPYSDIHIGGDETPTTAWQNNAECQALMEKEGFSNIRELQSLFVRRLADHLAQKEGDKKRNVIMWNESLTASGTNIDLIDGTEGTLMCWENGQVQPGALKAAQLGMKSIITPWGPYYINRKQSSDPSEPAVAGYGDDTVKKTYEYVPVPSTVPAALQKYYIGVQGTFWTEHVQSEKLLEYLALPRLIAIAETGWTPAARKNFTDFCERITKDTLLLDYNNYEYGRHFINDGKGDAKVMPESSTEDKKVWYRIITTATDNRAGKCIELLREDSPTIGTGNAKANRLWNGVVAQEGEAAYDYQLWAWMEDPDNPGFYAMVNKAKPNGSVKSTPTAENNTGRWDYDDSKRHYDFILGDRAYAANGNNYNYSIRSNKVSNTNMCMNFAGAGQNNSINLWSNPADGNGGIWEFSPLAANGSDIEISYPAQGDFVRIVNNVEKFNGWTIIDDGKATATVAAKEYAADVWEVVTATTTDAGQNITLRNTATGRYISGTAAPITLGTSAALLTNVYNKITGDFSIKAGDNALFPMPEKATTNPNTLGTGGIYPQGSAWRYEKVFQVTYDCYDTAGNSLGRYYSAAPAGEDFTCQAPAIKSHTVQAYETTGGTTAPTIASIAAHTTVKVTYERNAYNIVYRCKEERGGIIGEYEHSCIMGEEFNVQYPEQEFFTLISGNVPEGSFTPTADTTIDIIYTTEGKCGFAAVGNPVTVPTAGNSYLIYNAKEETNRSGYVSVSNIGGEVTTTNNLTEGAPKYIWTRTAKGNGYTVGNENGCYIPALNRGGRIYAAESGDTFTFGLNSDGITFSVKGSNNYYWNANSNNTLTGWSEGHPIMLYEYYVHPYFTVTYTCIDNEGNTLQSGASEVKGGDSYNLIVPQFDGLAVEENNVVYEDIVNVKKNIDITIRYSDKATGITAITADAICDNIYYDLYGRAYEYPAKSGIYIYNGKKVIIKK